MIAAKPRRKSARKLAKPARPVTETLLELAYYLHTTKVIARVKQPPTAKVKTATAGLPHFTFALNEISGVCATARLRRMLSGTSS